MTSSSLASPPQDSTPNRVRSPNRVRTALVGIGRNVRGFLDRVGSGLECAAGRVNKSEVFKFIDSKIVTTLIASVCVSLVGGHLVRLEQQSQLERTRQMSIATLKAEIAGRAVRFWQIYEAARDRYESSIRSKAEVETIVAETNKAIATLDKPEVETQTGVNASSLLQLLAQLQGFSEQSTLPEVQSRGESYANLRDRYIAVKKLWSSRRLVVWSA